MGGKEEKKKRKGKEDKIHAHDEESETLFERVLEKGPSLSIYLHHQARARAFARGRLKPFMKGGAHLSLRLPLLVSTRSCHARTHARTRPQQHARTHNSTRARTRTRGRKESTHARARKQLLRNSSRRSSTAAAAAVAATLTLAPRVFTTRLRLPTSPHILQRTSVLHARACPGPGANAAFVACAPIPEEFPEEFPDSLRCWELRRAVLLGPAHGAARSPRTPTYGSLVHAQRVCAQRKCGAPRRARAYGWPPGGGAPAACSSCALQQLHYGAKRHHTSSPTNTTAITSKN